MRIFKRKYDHDKERLERLFKRTVDLAKRKSHAEHETQRAYADFLFTFLDLPRYRFILIFKGVSMVRRIQDMHRKCCPAILDENQ